MNAFTVEEVHKSVIRVGDCIAHNGKEMTVCQSDLTNCEFFGIKIFGDCYRLGYQPVKRLKYIGVKQ